MIKSRGLLLGLMLLAITGIVVVALALLPPRPGITKENVDRIEVGMTRTEVEAILGGKANGEECSGEAVPNLWHNHVDTSQVLVVFNQDERVTATTFWEGWPDERTVWEKLLDRLPWREKSKRLPRCMS